jgi:hypothetical protein
MKRLILATLFISLLTIGSIPMFSHCYEVGFKVMDSSSNCISIPISVYERIGGTRIDNGNLNSSTLDGYNFQVDLNDNCPPYPPDCPVSCNKISLNPGTEYVIVFEYPAGDKSLCYIRDYLECEGGIYDTYYEVTPTSVSLAPGSDSCADESLTGYPDCSVIIPLSVSLVIYDTVYIGDKIVFYLRATATGGNQSYNFSWSNASRTSPTASTNPNTAKRTILQSQSATVTVTVTSGAEQVIKSKILRAD